MRPFSFNLAVKHCTLKQLFGCRWQYCLGLLLFFSYSPPTPCLHTNPCNRSVLRVTVKARDEFTPLSSRSDKKLNKVQRFLVQGSIVIQPIKKTLHLFQGSMCSVAWESHAEISSTEASQHKCVKYTIQGVSHKLSQSKHHYPTQSFSTCKYVLM